MDVPPRSLILAAWLCCAGAAAWAQPAPQATNPAAGATAPAATPAPAVPPANPSDASPTAPAETQVADQATRPIAEDLKKRIDAATDLTAAQKQSAAEQVDLALSQIKAAEDFAAAFKGFQQKTDNIETIRKDAQARLDALQAEKPAGLPADAPVTQIEQALASGQQDLVQAQAAVAKAEANLATRADRQKQIKDRLSRLPAEVEQTSQGLVRLAASTEPPLLVEALRLHLLADRKRQQVEPTALQAETAFLTAQETANLIQLERQYWTTRVSRLKDQVAQLQWQVLNHKTTDAQTRAQTIRDFADQETIPQIKDLYEDSAEAVEQELDIREKQKQIADEATRAKDLQDFLKNKLDQLKTKEKAIGASTSFGIRLREQRKLLEDRSPESLRRQIRERVPAYEQAQFDYLDVREQLARLDNLSKAESLTLAQIHSLGSASNQEQERLAQSVHQAYEQKQKSLNEQSNALDSYILSLDDLEAKQSGLAAQIEEFQRYIDERILWIPTHKPLTWSALTSDVHGLQRLWSAPDWNAVWKFFVTDAWRQTPLYLLAGGLWIGILATQRRQRQAIRNLGQRAGSRLNTAMRPTMAALFWTLVKSLAFPWPFLFLGWRAARGAYGPVADLGQSILTIAVWFWWLELVRNVCRPNGLGPSHFQWPARVNQTVTRQLSSFILLASPLVLLIAWLHAQGNDGDSNALERAFSLGFFLLLANTLHQLTSRKTGILREWIELHPGGWIERLAGFWNALAVLAPLTFAAMVVAGYTYAVERLSVRLAQTLMILFAATLLRALLIRWLTLRQRRLAIERAREVRAALAESPAAKEGAPTVLESQDSRVNLADVSAQTRRLLSTTLVTLSLVVLWLVWRSELPALQKLDAIDIPGTDQNLGAVLKAALAGVLFATAARNIPGLLEITLLENLPLDRSVRYALGALTRYVIVMIGMLAVAKSLSIQWSDIQWLLAALTFGLGFGLQEIFANFISGLIILFEQPVRVGDIVTIDNITGAVSRIRIRSTTITDWDRKEYIVPNKEFITGKLLNWTLSDTTNRVVIQVGVSYDASPDQVRDILLGIVRTQPHVLADPAPNVTFEGFGDSALNFVMRAFLASFEHRMETVHGLHVRIRQALKEAQIEIPYPQRDLHLRTWLPGAGNLTPASDHAASNGAGEAPAVAVESSE